MNPNDPANPSTSDRPKRQSTGWRLLRWGLVAFATLVTLLAFAYVEENWRGKRAWEAYRAELEAKGEKLDWKDFVPPPVPDDQNFAMTPFLAPLFDFNPSPKSGESRWRDTNASNKAMFFAKDIGIPKSSAGGWSEAQFTDLPVWALALAKKTNSPVAIAPSLTRPEAAAEMLTTLGQYDPILDELRAASRRPQSRFNMRYEDNFMMLLPHLTVLKQVGMICQLRANAELAQGQTEPALADVKMTFYLANAIRSEPVLISQLVRIALLQLSIQPVWEGLARHQWSDSQLAELDERLATINLLADYSRTLRGERAFGNRFFDLLRTHRKLALEAFSHGDSDTESGRGIGFSLMPSGWLYQNQLAFNRMHQEISLSMVDVPDQWIYPPGSAQKEGRLYTELYTGGFRPYKVFAALLFPALAKAEVKFAVAQTGINEARLACALERYRLAHSEFPQSLDALMPQFLPAIPHDLINGKPLIYHRTDDGQFILYSVGLNGKDDGGSVVLNKAGKRMDPLQGDWVWQYPAK